MRLTKHEINTIKSVVATNVEQPHKVYIFGSRIDDTKAGGDIDILVSMQGEVERPAWLSATISAELMMSLGEQKIDVLVCGDNSAKLPIYKIAAETGILL